MKKTFLLTLVFIVTLCSTTCLAGDDSAIWKSFSKESKLVYISGYINGAVTVCYSKKEILKETSCEFFTKYTMNPDNVIQSIDNIYKKNEYKNIPLRGAIFLSFAVDSKLLKTEDLFKICDKISNLKGHEDMVEGLLQ